MDIRSILWTLDHYLQQREYGWTRHQQRRRMPMNQTDQMIVTNDTIMLRSVEGANRKDVFGIVKHGRSNALVSCRIPNVCVDALRTAFDRSAARLVRACEFLVE